MSKPPKLTRDVPAFHDCDSAPFVYFDKAAALGVFGGAIQLELAAHVLIPDGDGVAINVVPTAHLRCSPTAAMHLRDAITKALDMAANPEQGAPVAANKLN